MSRGQGIRSSVLLAVAIGATSLGADPKSERVCKIEGTPREMKYLPDPERLVVLTSQGKAIVLRATDLEEALSLPWTDGPGAISRSSSKVFVLASVPGRKIRISELSEAGKVTEVHAGTEQVTALDLSPDAATVVAGTADGSVECHPVAPGSEGWRRRLFAKPMSGDPQATRKVEFSRSGAWIAALGSTGGLRILDANSGRDLATLREDGLSNLDTRPECISISPDSNTLAVGTHSGGLEIWNTRRWECILRQDLGKTAIWRIAFAPDSTMLATIDLGRQCKVLKLPDGKQVYAATVGTAPLAAICWSIDATQITCACDDGSIFRISGWK